MEIHKLSEFKELTIYIITAFDIDRYNSCYILKDNKTLSYSASFHNSNNYFPIEDVSRLIHLWELGDLQLRNRIKNELLVLINKLIKQEARHKSTNVYSNSSNPSKTLI